MFKKVAIILVNYKDYAAKYLAACWQGLQAQDYLGDKRIFIVDNASSPDSLAVIQKIAPTAEIIINQNNDGFAKGNNDAMKRALRQGFDYVILFNLDTVAADDCLSQMIEAAEAKSTGAVQARLMLDNQRDTINSLGNVTHFLGFGYAAGYGEKMSLPRRPLSALAPGLDPRLTAQAGDDNYICYPSGAAVLFKAEVLKKIGLFDEAMWMYNEDQDLGWRLWLSGFKCILAPKAVVYHKYEFSRSIKKYYYLDRNRMIAMLKNYHWATLLLILPAFLIMEFGLIFFSLKRGWFKEKIKVYNYFLSLKNWRRILKERRQTQSLRRITDQEVVKLFSGKIWYQEVGDNKLKIANIIFNTYWQLVKVFIRW